MEEQVRENSSFELLQELEESRRETRGARVAALARAVDYERMRFGPRRTLHDCEFELQEVRQELSVALRALRTIAVPLDLDTPPSPIDISREALERVNQLRCQEARLLDELRRLSRPQAPPSTWWSDNNRTPTDQEINQCRVNYAMLHGSWSVMPKLKKSKVKVTMRRKEPHERKQIYPDSDTD